MRKIICVQSLKGIFPNEKNIQKVQVLFVFSGFSFWNLSFHLLLPLAIGQEPIVLVYCSEINLTLWSYKECWWLLEKISSFMAYLCLWIIKTTYLSRKICSRSTTNCLFSRTHLYYRKKEQFPPQQQLLGEFFWVLLWWAGLIMLIAPSVHRSYGPVHWLIGWCSWIGTCL